MNTTNTIIPMKPESMNNWNPTPAAWKRQFDETGYLVVPEAIDADTLAQLQNEMERLETAFKADELSPRLRSFVHTERDRSAAFGLGGSDSDSGEISVVMELPLFAPAFAELIGYPRVLDVLETLFDSSEFSFHNYKAVCKMPGNATPFQWHRDLPYLHHTGPNLITCMLCLDPMTPENGATVICPGSHLNAPPEPLPGDTNMAEDAVPTQRTTVECPAGSAVLFHVNVVHGGGPNLSRTKRRNVIGIWAGPNTLPTTPARYAYEFLKPRSADPLHQRQMEMTFGATT